MKSLKIWQAGVFFILCSHHVSVGKISRWGKVLVIIFTNGAMYIVTQNIRPPHLQIRCCTFIAVQLANWGESMLPWVLLPTNLISARSFLFKSIHHMYYMQSISKAQTFNHKHMERPSCRVSTKKLSLCIWCQICFSKLPWPRSSCLFQPAHIVLVQIRILALC